MLVFYGPRALSIALVVLLCVHASADTILLTNATSSANATSANSTESTTTNSTVTSSPTFVVPEFGHVDPANCVCPPEPPCTIHPCPPALPCPCRPKADCVCLPPPPCTTNPCAPAPPCPCDTVANTTDNTTSNATQPAQQTSNNCACAQASTSCACLVIEDGPVITPAPSPAPVSPPPVPAPGQGTFSLSHPNHVMAVKQCYDTCLLTMNLQNLTVADGQKTCREHCGKIDTVVQHHTGNAIVSDTIATSTPASAPVSAPAANASTAAPITPAGPTAEQISQAIKERDELLKKEEEMKASLEAHRRSIVDSKDQVERAKVGLKTLAKQIQSQLQDVDVSDRLKKFKKALRSKSSQELKDLEIKRQSEHKRLELQHKQELNRLKSQYATKKAKLDAVVKKLEADEKLQLEKQQAVSEAREQLLEKQKEEGVERALLQANQGLKNVADGAESEAKAANLAVDAKEAAIRDAVAKEKKRRMDQALQVLQLQIATERELMIRKEKKSSAQATKQFEERRRLIDAAFFKLKKSYHDKRAKAAASFTKALQRLQRNVAREEKMLKLKVVRLAAEFKKRQRRFWKKQQLAAIRRKRVLALQARRRNRRENKRKQNRRGAAARAKVARTRLARKRHSDVTKQWRLRVRAAMKKRVALRRKHTQKVAQLAKLHKAKQLAAHTKWLRKMRQDRIQHVRKLRSKHSHHVSLRNAQKINRRHKLNKKALAAHRARAAKKQKWWEVKMHRLKQRYARMVAVVRKLKRSRAHYINMKMNHKKLRQHQLVKLKKLNARLRAQNHLRTQYLLAEQHALAEIAKQRAIRARLHMSRLQAFVHAQTAIYRRNGRVALVEYRRLSGLYRQAVRAQEYRVAKMKAAFKHERRAQMLSLKHHQDFMKMRLQHVSHAVGRGKAAVARATARIAARVRKLKAARTRKSRLQQADVKLQQRRDAAADKIVLIRRKLKDSTAQVKVVQNRVENLRSSLSERGELIPSQKQELDRAVNQLKLARFRRNKQQRKLRTYRVAWARLRAKAEHMAALVRVEDARVGSLTRAIGHSRRVRRGFRREVRRRLAALAALRAQAKDEIADRKKQVGLFLAQRKREWAFAAKQRANAANEGAGKRAKWLRLYKKDKELANQSAQREQKIQKQRINMLRAVYAKKMARIKKSLANRKKFLGKFAQSTARQQKTFNKRQRIEQNVAGWAKRRRTLKSATCTEYWTVYEGNCDTRTHTRWSARWKSRCNPRKNNCEQICCKPKPMNCQSFWNTMGCAAGYRRNAFATSRFKRCAATGDGASSCNAQCCNFVPPGRGKCTVWGDPHVITFDNYRFDCSSSGEYVMYENQGWKEEVRNQQFRLPHKKWHQASPFTNGVAFRSESDVISVSLIRPSWRTFGVKLQVNGAPMPYPSGRVVYGDFVVTPSGTLPDHRSTCKHSGFHLTTLSILNKRTRTAVSVRYRCWGPQVRHLEVSVSNALPQFHNSKSRGICGTFNGKAGDDLKDRAGRKCSPLNSNACCVSWRAKGKSFFPKRIRKFKVSGSRMCTLAPTCSAGWKDLGAAGVLGNSKKNRPFFRMGSKSKTSNWFHPRICCADSAAAKVRNTPFLSRSCSASLQNRGEVRMLTYRRDLVASPLRPVKKGGNYKKKWKWTDASVCVASKRKSLVQSEQATCMMAGKCPSPFVDHGRVGILTTAKSARALEKRGFVSGKNFNGSFRWTHPRLCCSLPIHERSNAGVFKKYVHRTNSGALRAFFGNALQCAEACLRVAHCRGFVRSSKMKDGQKGRCILKVKSAKKLVPNKKMNYFAITARNVTPGSVCRRNKMLGQAHRLCRNVHASMRQQCYLEVCSSRGKNVKNIMTSIRELSRRHRRGRGGKRYRRRRDRSRRRNKRRRARGRGRRRRQRRGRGRRRRGRGRRRRNRRRRNRRNRRNRRRRQE